MPLASRPESRTSPLALGRLLALALLLATAAPLSAQRKASERARTVQRINGTWITVDYARPTARGRDDLFGGVVHWGEMWTPGANWATTLEADRDIRLDGHPLPAGDYSVWLEVKEGGTWTLHLVEETALFHTERPDPEDAFLSYDVAPRAAESHMEALAWYFPSVAFDRAKLRMHWGDTYVPFEVEVTPWEPPELTRAQIEAYTGRYRWVEADDEGPADFDVVLTDEGRLRMQFDEWGFDLVPFALHGFYDVTYRDGRRWEVGIENPYYFVVEHGVVTGLEVYLGDRKVREAAKVE
ncbi:MAG TPA: DUF2911 domain-containing protein [Gemmatimonadota bacterium]|nr:DUF2911 domain-containing protein [Gemmatimonadota bacterium]